MDANSALVIVALVKELGKEVYGDLLSPSAKQVGGMLDEGLRAIRHALPANFDDIDLDRYVRFLRRSKGRVAPERLHTPAAQILGPVLEGIRYEPVGSITDEAFSELLTRAFDRERVAQAHPAFPAMIRSLSEDEIRLIRALAPLEPRPIPVGDIPVPELRAADIGIVHRESFPLYVAHLGVLGLTVQPFGWAPEHCLVMIEGVHTYMLSGWGKVFAEAIATSGDADAST